PQPVPTGKPKVKPVPTGKPKVTPVPTSKLQVSTPVPTDTEWLVLSKDFKLTDDSMVVLKVLMKHNLYTINLNDLCPRGKQHKASYKGTNVVSSIFEPLQLLHMDLFGPTSIRSIDHKYYCLVITDDYSRFCWVFFLEHKDETYPILKDFINLVENQLNKKTEAVRTACYVLNRVSIASPHNKTPYALLTGNIPSVSHFKPFGCHVTIINTSDYLGKFDGKSNEGYIVGYSASNNVTPPKMCVAAEYYLGVLLHNTTSQDTRERPLKVSFVK
nr:ribonuclease H-like domain-containing protein [Tanacetum cinerariifolium]